MYNYFIYNGSSGSLFGSLPNRSTAQLTFYASAGNPSYGSAVYPTWSYTVLGTNALHLMNNINAYLFYTQNQTDTVVGYFGMQHCYLLDAGGHANLCNCQIQETFPNIIYVGSTYNLYGASFKAHLLYSGSGVSGNWFPLQ